ALPTYRPSPRQRQEPLPIARQAAHNGTMSRRVSRTKAYAPDPAAPAGRGCEMPGCEAPGEYRAPKDRRNLKDYWWFCLEHVRAYTSTWHYYRGMSPAEIEAQLRADTAWQRPSWPLGRIGKAATWDEELLRDPLHLLAAGRVKRGPAQPSQQTPPELREP